MKKIMAIGAGGIMSFAIRELFNLYENDVDGLKDIEVTIFDGDKVEEKNLKYQNFTIDDLGKNKAEALSERYLFPFKKEMVLNEDQLKDYDVYFIGVDNGKLRELIYNYCDKHKDKRFIDMRSEGRAVAFYTTHQSNILDKLMATIEPDAPATSCQLKFELDAGIIQVGNRVIANIGIQLLLNELRGDKNIASWTMRF